MEKTTSCSHVALKNARKTLGAPLSPFFPKRSGGCAPEASVVAKQPSAGLSALFLLGAVHISRLLRAQVRYFKCRRAVCALIMEATRSRCDALVFSRRVRAASR